MLKKKRWSLLLLLLMVFSFGLFVTVTAADEAEFVGGIGIFDPDEIPGDQPVTLQLENGEELTLVRLRIEDKTITPVSSKEAAALLEPVSVVATVPSATVATTQASPTWFHIWPKPASTVIPEAQTYWYRSNNDTIYIAVANAVPVRPFDILPADMIPYHVGVTGKLNGVTKNEDTSMRHRLFMSTTSNGWGIKMDTAIYMNMGNAGSPHVGYVHFFPLWVFSNLTTYPSGYFEATDSTSKQAYQTIRFSSSTGFSLVGYQYVP